MKVKLITIDKTGKVTDVRMVPYKKAKMKSEGPSKYKYCWLFN